MKTKRFSITCLSLVIMMLLSSVIAIPAHAAERENVKTESVSEETDIMPRAGNNEVLPLGGPYQIGPFTFTDTNLTPTKIPAGRYVDFIILFKKASKDAGLGNVKLTINVRDANTGQILTRDFVQVADTNPYAGTILATNYIDLGYANRPIQIWFDASSTGQSNGNFRSIEIMDFASFVKN